MRKRHVIFILSMLLASSGMQAQHYQQLVLPNRELLSSDKVLDVIQDSEGFLWYATEGGVCRDDGRQVDVFRSDAEHPDLLGSNNVICLSQAGRYIIIGTSHGAYVLDKRDYSIRRLADVDDKRVDDIIVSRNGHWWLTANKKVYEYSAEGKLLNTYPVGDKYIFRLHEDQQGRLWCRQWEGAMLRFDGGRFVEVTTEWPDSIDFSRVSADCNGRRLVADGLGKCYALSSSDQQPWYDGQILTRLIADSIRTSRGLSARPTAIAGHQAELWFSTGKDIRLMRQNGGEAVIIDTKDVSAMTFTNDGTLWLATIFGQLYKYRDGKVEKDEYGSNEYGDGVIAMTADSLGRLVMVSDHYIRIYDTQRHTMRQQSREEAGAYCIELQETEPNQRWSQPAREKVVERFPRWLKSWWMCCVYLLLIAGVTLLAIHNYMLRQQRRQFLEQMRSLTPDRPTPSPSRAGGESEYSYGVVYGEEAYNLPSRTGGVGGGFEAGRGSAWSEWLKGAIAQVEVHLNDEGYTVEQLSSDLCMSRMTFYRKIQSLTGQKPTEFMRTIRLRRAAELLREGRMTITEISYATGFSSVSYFSRCFRTMFGVPPTQFGKTTTAEGLSPNENPS